MSAEFAAYDRLGGLVIVLTPTGCISYWNRTCAELSGLELAAVQGQPIWQVASAQADRATWQEVVSRLQLEDRVGGFASTWSLDSGLLRRIVWTGVAETVDPPGRRLVFTGVDVSGVDAHREAGLTQLRALLEQAPEGIFVADLAGRYTDVKDAGCRLLGYAHDELIGRSIAELIPPEDVDRLWGERQQMLQGQPMVAEWKLRRKDGRYVPVEIIAAILPDGRWQALVRDISERKHLQRALTESYDHLYRAQAIARVGSWRLDIGPNALWWSDENYRIFGIPPGTPMTYETFLACVHPDDRDVVDRMWQAALLGEPYDIEHRIVVADAVRWVREKADLTFGEDGALLGGIGITQDITERKEADALLQQAQERLELALKGADLATWDWNVQTGEIVFNARWAEMRGYRPDEVPPQVEAWFGGIHPDDLPRVQRSLRDYLEGRLPDYENEHRVRTKDGRWIWILDQGKVFARDDQGRPVRMVGTALDVTERRHIDEALRLSEARARGIVAISADAIISIDDRHRITLFNAGAEAMFGYTEAEALGAPFAMLIPERRRAQAEQLLTEFASGEATARRMGDMGGLVVGLRQSGDEFPADAAISKLDLGGKRLLKVAIRDVTEQKRIEGEQRFLAEVGSVLASSLDYEETLTQLAQMVVQEIADVCVVDILGQDQGLRRLKVAGRDPSLAWACEALERFPLDRRRPHLFLSVLQTEQPLLIPSLTPDDLTALTQSEAHRQVLGALAPRSLVAVRLVAHGKLLGAIALISSSPARTYGPADVRLAAELAHRAAFAIENAQLYHTAQRAIQARDDVLGVVAHDLRNPLGIILMNAVYLQRTADEAGRSRADAISRAVKRMNRLIQDLLDVTRIAAGRLPLSPEQVPTAALVGEAVDAQRALAESAGKTLRLDLAPDLPAVWADRHRLLQVFENLISNALKFTPSGGGITVAGEVRDGDVLFRVSDTGIGVAPAAIPHLFDPYWQAEKSDSRGAGLGLPIVKGVVEAHGGRVWAESKLGSGSTFHFTIPVAVPAHGCQPSEAGTLDAGTA